VATKAHLGYTLVRQHMPVRRAVRAMTRRATFGARGWVLEHERATFVGMAPDAFFLLEAAEQRPRRGLVWIVARRAFEDSFANAMMLVVPSFGELLAMTLEADARRAPLSCRFRQPGRLPQQRRGRVLAVLLMAARASQACESVRAAIEARMRVLVAPQTARVALGYRLVAKREHGPAAGIAHVLADVAMTVATRQRLASQRSPVRIVEHCMRVALNRLELVAVADVALPRDAHRGSIARRGWCLRLGRRAR